VEADVQRFFNESKAGFIGKEATLKVREQGPEIKIVYLDLEPGDNDIVGGEPLMDGEKVIGITTSGGYGHYTGKSLGFGYVETPYAEQGKQFEVELLGQKRKVKVISDPVWDPASERSRA
jgi:dimethylglycine dehydrogenase